MILQKETFSTVAIMTCACLLIMATSVTFAKSKQIPGSRNHHNTAGMNHPGVAIGLHKNSSLKFHHGSNPATGPANPAISAGVVKGKGPKFSAMPSSGMGTHKGNGPGQAAKPGHTSPFSGSPYTPKIVSNGIMVKTHPGKNIGNFQPGFPGRNGCKSKFILGAGDAFSEACDFTNLCGSMEVPNPIGAKGPNPKHGGQHPKKGFGNPGGGNGKGHWGQGNQGNGKGNIWCGNQGHGVGEGMAGGCGGNNGGGGNGGGNGNGGNGGNGGDDNGKDSFVATAAAPLFHKPELEFSGCPALLQWTANELGIPEGQLQIYIKNTLASPTNIQPCDVCAQLQTAALTLKDVQGRRVSALTAVIGEAIVPDAPITPEQMAVIATALAEAEQGSEYASAAEYIDAAETYVHLLISEFGFTLEESLELVSKYTITIEDESVANYVLVRIAQIQG